MICFSSRETRCECISGRFTRPWCSCESHGLQGDYQPSELLSFDGNSWLSYEDGVQAVTSLPPLSTQGSSHVHGTSPSSSEVSGDSPRELESPLSARSLEPEADEVRP